MPSRTDCRTGIAKKRDPVIIGEVLDYLRHHAEVEIDLLEGNRGKDADDESSAAARTRGFDADRRLVYAGYGSMLSEELRDDTASAPEL
jgi:hypothetical protein